MEQDIKNINKFEDIKFVKREGSNPIFPNDGYEGWIKNISNSCISCRWKHCKRCKRNWNYC